MQATHTLTSEAVGQDLIPLVVDLDGTLVRSDMLVESFLDLARLHPLRAVATIAALRGGKASLKAKIADQVLLDYATIPLREEVVQLIEQTRAEGRPVVLASASDARIVRALADHLGLFDEAWGSSETLNLDGARKAQFLCERYGERGFDYVGNARCDLDVWAHARHAYTVGLSTGVARAVRRLVAEPTVVARPDTRAKDYLRAMRPHQWIKNALIFAPAMADHDLSLATLGVLALAVLSFSLCASSVYILNDLLDLRGDRSHHRKRTRPFAAGRVPLLHGVLLFPALLLSSAAIGLLVGLQFLLVLAGYYALTLGYSLWLKRKAIVDVLALASLYGARLVAGAQATDIRLSIWLVAFSIFLFLSLALVKRCTELRAQIDRGRQSPVGRGYRNEDLPLLLAMAVASGYVAALVIAMYFATDSVMVLYKHPERMIVSGIGLLYWCNRIYLLCHRGELHDDPVVFAGTDRISLATGAIVLGGILASV